MNFNEALFKTMNRLIMIIWFVWR